MEATPSARLYIDPILGGARVAESYRGVGCVDEITSSGVQEM